MATSDAPLVLVVEAAKRLAAHADATPSLKGDDQVEFTKTFAHDLVATSVALGGTATLQMYETVTETLQRCVDGEYGGQPAFRSKPSWRSFLCRESWLRRMGLNDTVLQARAMGRV